MPKEYRQLVRVALSQGWRHKASGGGHLKMYSPDGETIVTLPCSPPSGKRSLENCIGEFRRGGLDCKGIKS